MPEAAGFDCRTDPPAYLRRETTSHSPTSGLRDMSPSVKDEPDTTLRARELKVRKLLIAKLNI
jgi:hypothetical protein